MDTNTNLQKKLSKIQKELEAPKNQVNKFGGYNYRSAEDILNAVKPLLGDAILTVSDDLEMMGDRFYVKATAKLQLGDEAIKTTAFAREEEAKKGMDSSQITGSASSYARKYALNGLFCIDDTKDADTMDNTANTGTVQKKTPLKPAEERKQNNEMTVGEVDTGDKPKPASERQLNKIKYDMNYLLRVGYARAKLDATIQEFAPSIEDLTMSQASSLIGKLQEMSTMKSAMENRTEEKAKSPKIDDPTVNF